MCAVARTPCGGCNSPSVLSRGERDAPGRRLFHCAADGSSAVHLWGSVSYYRTTVTFPASHQAPCVFAVCKHLFLELSDAHRPPHAVHRAALLQMSPLVFKDAHSVSQHTERQLPKTQLDCEDTGVLVVCCLSVCLSVADGVDASVSATDLILKHPQPLCLHCQMGIIDGETFGPVASP